MATDTLSQLRGGQLAGITRLDLSCGLIEFPPEIFDLADSLEILNLSGNQLRDLPDDFPKLKKLKVVFLSQNDFTHVPPVLGQCPELSMIGFKSNRITEVDGRAFTKALRWLILTDNRIRELPGELGDCPELQKLMLAGNRLKSLPESMAACQNLELLRLAANEFETLPGWLWHLPRLAWLAIGGNPCSVARSLGSRGEMGVSVIVDEPIISEVPWGQLRLEEKLGEGASGVIHRARWAASPARVAGTGEDEESEGVAVKIFKGAVTSDGLPASEMAACLAVGQHPNLIGVRGRVSGHPEGSDALVMPLISPDFLNLAGPPSLESCTRDIYPPGFRISLPVALRMAQGLASAAAHLHGRGILHGDLYAHNVLRRENGDCLLGDFGAASQYDLETSAYASSLERIEVRAFGCLLEELLDHCLDDQAGPEPWAEKTRNELQKLVRDCLRPEVDQRPSFDEIKKLLRDLPEESQAEPARRS